jgi:hypothetical protein
VETFVRWRSFTPSAWVNGFEHGLLLMGGKGLDEFDAAKDLALGLALRARRHEQIIG